MKKLTAAFLSATVILFLMPARATGAGKGGSSDLYEITKYSRRVSGHSWRYVLVDDKVTKRDIETIYADLRERHPNDYFELFNDMDTLVAMYKHSIKRGKFPDTDGHLGMINQMGYDQEWKFTTMSGYGKLKD